MTLTKEQRKEIEKQIEDFLTNILGPLEVEDFEEAGDVIRQEVDDELTYMIALQKML